jgi:hypothetical protein
MPLPDLVPRAGCIDTIQGCRFSGDDPFWLITQGRGERGPT